MPNPTGTDNQAALAAASGKAPLVANGASDGQKPSGSNEVHRADEQAGVARMPRTGVRDDAGGKDAGAGLPHDPARPVAKRAFKIMAGDKNNKPITPLPNMHPDPYAPEAVSIGFAITGDPMPTTQQMELQGNIEKVLRTCTSLYLKCGVPRQDSFRIYYVRIFFLAQLGLEVGVPAELANALLASITADLIDDEAATMKNQHLVKLGRYAAYYSIPALLAYLAVKFLPEDMQFSLLWRLEIDPAYLAGFAILWVGCFIGVWLSYGIRKTRMSLTDLTLSEADYLAPHIRLLFAGLLTMILGILFAQKFITLSIGSVVMTDITHNPLSALLVGLFCGISEAALPASIGSRAAKFIQDLK